MPCLFKLGVGLLLRKQCVPIIRASPTHLFAGSNIIFIRGLNEAIENRPNLHEI